LTSQYGTFDSTFTSDLGTDSTLTYNYYKYLYGEPLPGSLQRFNEDWNTASTMLFNITRDSRDLPEFATSGSTISYTFAVTGGVLGGFWKYRRHELTLSKFIRVIGKVALAGKVQFGAISASSDDQILEFDRYSPGGTGYDGIVRGYDDGSLTPDSTILSSVRYEYYSTDVDNVRPEFSGETSPDWDSTITIQQSYTRKIRGKYMLVGNLELQVPIIENQLYSLLFFDVGNSWLHRKDINIFHVYRGVGFGFRLVVPGIGTIGFDFGYPLDKRSGQDKSWHPHFQVGTTFR